REPSAQSKSWILVTSCKKAKSRACRQLPVYSKTKNLALSKATTPDVLRIRTQYTARHINEISSNPAIVLFLGNVLLVDTQGINPDLPPSRKYSMSRNCLSPAF